MTRLILVFSLGLVACADDPEPKNNTANNPTNNATNNPTNNSTNSDGPCFDFSATKCPSRCVVHTTSCNDFSMSGCFEPDQTPSPIPCNELEPEQCQDQSTRDSCDLGVCTWVRTGGCGDLDELIFNEEPVCLPIQDCTPGNEATECPSDHTCWGLTVDPCGGGGGDISCQACAAHFNRCVPNRYIPEE